jgi:fatty acid amide hydrolase 2
VTTGRAEHPSPGGGPSGARDGGAIDVMSPASAQHELLRLPVVELRARVRDGDVTPLELVDAHIQAILAWNPIVNAVVANRFEDARREARAQTEALAHAEADDLPPLFGVPCTVKECFGVEGMPWTSGSLLRSGMTAPRSATVVHRVVEAGAIPLGVTNMPEMAMWMETDNLLYGRTNNPWDPRRTAGGSSGGEGAIVAAGASPFGVGSDVGGSIRLPALFCGVFGQKSTGGLVPATGHVPSPSERASRFVSVGPVCRSARDLAPILEVMARGADPVARAGLIGDPTRVRVDRLTVHVVRDDGRSEIAPALRAAQGRAAAALEARGARVVETALPELREAFDLWADSLQETNEKRFEDWLGGERQVELLRQLALFALKRPRHTLPSLLFLAVERVSSRVNLVRGGYARAQAFKARLEELLGADGVILFPPFPRTAPPHGSLLRAPAGFLLSAIWNVLEVCSTAVPLGFDGEGLPTGVQVIGRPGNDATTIAVAMALEADLGGWQPPPPPR